MEPQMPQDTDDKFFERADAYISLANQQVVDSTRGKVSASMMYATSRFNAWVGACNCESAEELAAAREQAIEYFVKQYREMLTENLDQYIQNFDAYMAAAQEGKG
jgi:hypothetical protein